MNSSVVMLRIGRRFATAATRSLYRFAVPGFSM
jgi:hypothetical protein